MGFRDCFQLLNAKANVYFGKTRDAISRLLRLTVQTGFLTSILAIPIIPLFLESSPTGSVITTLEALPYVPSRSVS
jgi:hypothetical protein